MTTSRSISIEEQLHTFISDLFILCQDPHQWEYRAAFVRLKTLIIRQAGCENDAKTIKTIVTELFQAVIRCEDIQHGASPRVVAFLTHAILEIIPESVKDWTKTGETNNKGKPLFSRLLVDKARSYLQAPNAGKGERENNTRSRRTGEEKPEQPVVTSLSHTERVNLVEFIGELAEYTLIPSAIVHEYAIRLLHSLAVPTPTRSELEAVCRMLGTAHSILQQLAWLGSIYNALELVRQRAAGNLDPSLRVLLLVLFFYNLIMGLGNYLEREKGRKRV